MLGLAFASLSFQPAAPVSRVSASRVTAPMMVSRRDILTTVSGAMALASPLAASAYENGQSKAKGIFGQKVLALLSADAATIADNEAAITTYVGQMIRATGKRNVDSRRLGGTPLGDAAVAAIKSAKAGDTAGAQDGLKKIVALTKLTKVPPLGTKDNPFPGGVSMSSLSGTTGTPGSW